MLEIAVLVICVVLLAVRWRLQQMTIGYYDGRHVLITGCDSGFGKLLALRLVEMGYSVFAGCLTEEGLNELKQSSSKRLKTILLDVTKTDSIVKAVEFVESALPEGKGLWGLVNNAGVMGPSGHIQWLSAEDYQPPLQVNMLGMVETTRLFLPLLIKEKGRIVNMTSTMGRVAACSAPYCASKFAAEGYSDILRRSISRSGVSVHILEPGFFRTNLTEFSQFSDNVEQSFEKQSESVKEYYGVQYKNDLIRKGSSNWKRCSKRTDVVIDAYVHALSARFPRYRYVIGWDANFLFRFLWTTPEWIVDPILAMQAPVPSGEKSS
ncbi:hypothetical protein FSP39_017942 [Pinctada imbricata]|uniref:Uncharacterized protein n=1 Tax=Pinctada imbricata TaxID=66713 RepID=A0AA88Y1B1_PINIB|nr:hypothetical protein FSP39_017942 [Pinctada imbricata]